MKIKKPPKKLTLSMLFIWWIYFVWSSRCKVRRDIL